MMIASSEAHEPAFAHGAEDLTCSAALPAGVPTQNGGAHDGRKKGKNTAALAAAAQQNGDCSAAAAAGFIPADTFQGPRAGYAFKAGSQGTGYYRDR